MIYNFKLIKNHKKIQIIQLMTVQSHIKKLMYYNMLTIKVFIYIVLFSHTRTIVYLQHKCNTNATLIVDPGYLIQSSFSAYFAHLLDIISESGYSIYHVSYYM